MTITTAELNNHMKSLLHLIENKTTSLADGLLRVPTALYTDKSYWQQEVGEIFYRQPLALGLSCQVPTSNSYHALEEVPGFRVVLTRDADGVAHGFFNSCSHRGAPVASGSQQRGRFSCPYHGWTYNTKGELIGLSESDTYGAKPCADLHLVEFPVEERHGIIFGVLDPQASLDLDAWLGDFGPELEKIGLAGMTAMWSQAFEGPNWKVCKDGFIENYHFASVHSKSLPTLMSNTNLTDIFGLHARVLMPHKHIVAEGEKPEAEWASGTTFESVFVMFPSTMIASAWGDWPLVTRIFPGKSPEQSTCVQTLLCRLPYTEELQKQADDLQDLYKSVTQDEDYVLDFAIQQSLENTAHEHFCLGRNELSVQHFHRSISQIVTPLSPLEELSNV